MMQKKDEWQFLRLRAAQLYEEGDAEGALLLLENLHQEQIARFALQTMKYEQTENC